MPKSIAGKPEPIEEIRPGDVVWVPWGGGEKHWHGATATTAMTHIGGGAIQEKLDDKAVEWMEKVGDEQYRA